MASILVWPSDRGDIMVKHAITCSLCFPNDVGWIAVKLGFY